VAAHPTGGPTGPPGKCQAAQSALDHDKEGPHDDDAGDVCSSVFGPVNSMGPSEVRQYLYCLRPLPSVSADVRQMKNVTLIGKLDIVWKSNMAERGRLQTSPLQRMVSVYVDKF